MVSVFSVAKTIINYQLSIERDIMTEDAKTVRIIAVIKKQVRTDKGVEIVLTDCTFEQNEQKLVTDKMIGGKTDVVVTITPQQLEML